MEGGPTTCEPDEDGWIEHTGDECPVDPEAEIIIRNSSGEELTGFARKASFFYWNKSISNIIHYKIIKEAESKPSAPDKREHTEELAIIDTLLTCIEIASGHGYEGTDLLLAYAWLQSKKDELQ